MNKLNTMTVFLLTLSSIFSGVLAMQSQSLKQRLESLELANNKLGNRVKELESLTSRNTKFVDSFSLQRVDYLHENLKVGGTFLHHAFHAVDQGKPDVNGNTHKLVLPGLDHDGTRTACWVLDWEK